MMDLKKSVGFCVSSRGLLVSLLVMKASVENTKLVALVFLHPESINIIPYSEFEPENDSNVKMC